jgi:hypothetical protein
MTSSLDLALAMTLAALYSLLALVALVQISRIVLHGYRAQSLSSPYFVVLSLLHVQT